MLPVFAFYPGFHRYAFALGAFDILGVFFAVRVFGGKGVSGVASYQMFYSLIMGTSQV